ncbi:hypothetical protein K376_00163 [Streptomyces sp. PsTaAH-130]|nr:hypothetical protein K376_00163 [Streptomyces sp. PsTaAH-130]
MERIAVSLLTYECRVVPGLLQTEAYARAVFTVGPEDWTRFVRYAAGI